MNVLYHQVMDSMNRLILNYTTPPDKVTVVLQQDMPTCVIQQQPSRRGPDDYTPVNLRHELEYEYYVDSERKNK